MGTTFTPSLLATVLRRSKNSGKATLNSCRSLSMSWASSLPTSNPNRPTLSDAPDFAKSFATSVTAF